MTTGMLTTLALGPATVLSRNGRQLTIEREGIACTAELAMPCLPNAGDVVLVAGQQPQAWVIGIIDARHTVWELPGDLAIRSAGSIDLSAAAGLRLRAAEVAVAGDH